jgi:branched-chain amino acid transport system permease protein
MICSSALRCSELVLQLLVYGISNGAALALNAMSVTVVYSTVRVLNLAHGDVFALASAFVTTVITFVKMQPNWSASSLVSGLALILLATLIFAALLMAAIERLAFQPFRGKSQLAPLIATLGISLMLYQVALIWRMLLPSWVPQDHRSVPGLPEVPIDRIPTLLPSLDLVKALHLPLDVVIRGSDLLMLVVAVTVALLVRAFLQHTRLGRGIRACAQNAEMAQLCGVNVNQTIRQAFLFGGVLAGAAAFIFALYYERPVGNNGADSGLLAFAAAILGGIGNPVGALLSGLLIGICGAFSDYFLSAEWTPVLLQLLLVIVLVLRPTGIAAEDSGDLAHAGRDAAVATPTQSFRQDKLLLGWILAMLMLPLLDALLGWGKQILITQIGIFVLLGLGLNLLLGWAGLLDLGYIISFGVGGYMAAALLPAQIDFLLILLLSALLAGLSGIGKAKLAVRLRHDYLAVVTLALGLLLPQVLINLNDWTGGVGGIAALPPPRLLSHSLSRPVEKYYLVAVLVMGVILGSQRLIRSRIGRAWLASSEDEIAAVSCGVNLAQSKTLAFVISSAIAGIAGALYVGTFAYIAPDLIEFQNLAMVLAMVILGGAGSILGVMIGSVVIVGSDLLFLPWLAEMLAKLQPSGLHFAPIPDIRGLSYLLFGLTIYLTVLYRARQ